MPNTLWIDYYGQYMVLRDTQSHYDILRIYLNGRVEVLRTKHGEILDPEKPNPVGKDEMDVQFSLSKDARVLQGFSYQNPDFFVELPLENCYPFLFNVKIRYRNRYQTVGSVLKQ